MRVATATVNGWASPLREIEIAAQGRAKAEALDMESEGAVDRLRQLLAEEVESWRSEYRRGRRPVDIADPAIAVERALKNLAGYEIGRAHV